MKFQAIFQSERKVDRLEGLRSYWNYLVFQRDSSVYFTSGAEKFDEILKLARTNENFKIGKYTIEKGKLKFSVCDRVSLALNGVEIESIDSYRFQGELKGDWLGPEDNASCERITLKSEDSPKYMSFSEPEKFDYFYWLGKEGDQTKSA